MAYRDNTKPLTPTLNACKGPPGNSAYGESDTLRNIARPGKRNNNVPKGADNVMSANGKTPRPGYKQKTVPSPGVGSVARPGRAQRTFGNK